jgi:hypothetical protein
MKGRTLADSVKEHNVMARGEPLPGGLTWVVILEAGKGLNFARHDNTPTLCAEGDTLLVTAAYAKSIIESGFARVYTTDIAASLGEEPKEEPALTLAEVVGERLEGVLKELGYNTADDVRNAAATSDEELLAVPGIGVRKLADIRNKLGVVVD